MSTIPSQRHSFAIPDDVQLRVQLAVAEHDVERLQRALSRLLG